MPRSKVYTENGWIYEDDVIQDGYKSFYQSSEPTNAKVGDIWVNPDDMGSDYIYHEYSTSEKVVGKWIDGSTIYEKVFTGTITATGADINIGILTDYDKIISICGAVQCTDKCAYFLNDYGDVNSSGRLNIEIDVNGNVMMFSRKSIIVGADVIAIIHYTKSTNGGN